MTTPETQSPSPLAEAPGSVANANRQVIEHKLLTALDDKSKAAILVTKDDLRLLIKALAWFDTEASNKFAEGLAQLLREAFPPNSVISPN